MVFTDRRQLTRWILILSSFIIVILIVWNTYAFFQIFKEDERNKMELWAAAQKTLQNVDENTDLELPFNIISNNTSIPIIQTDEQDKIKGVANIDELIEQDSAKLYGYLDKLKRENNPIVIQYDEDKYQYLYYGNSSLLNKLKYYPIALLLIIFLFGLVVYNFYRTSKIAAQNRLWAGMAKETAHQIGTPLSSLIGWLEIMKAEGIDHQMVTEIEKDIHRLQVITDRFSKVGSEPALEKVDIIEATKNSFDYLKSRFSNQVHFSYSAPNVPIKSLINPELHSWTIENLMKNAVDAMKGKGSLSMDIVLVEDEVSIYISDSGKGIPKNQHKKIFDPGFTTKKRGWGLGLSLTKRIVEEYHKGKIRVHHSEPGKGTTMVVILKKC
jgi:signal transduction histidine kinase